MKVRLPLMIQDPTLTGVKKLVSTIQVDEPFFLDGPVTARVAILDFDETSGALRPGAPFFRLPLTRRGEARGEYRISATEPLTEEPVDGEPERYKIHTRAFNQVSLLGAILKTMYLFEDESVLGRQLEWAFDGPQLLVIPRAGEWANAFYQRETRSLQFFYFARPAGHGAADAFVQTSLSTDIIAHETAHAILDGIAPDLHDALLPQSLAFHEALADLTAVCVALDNWYLRDMILNKTAGQLDENNEFLQIAEEFGHFQGNDALRTLLLKDEPPLRLADAPLEPHFLSLVLSGALFEVMTELFQLRWDAQTAINQRLHNSGERTDWFKGPRDAAMFQALQLVGADFRRLAFGALDFLPPGEISFADYGRAMIGAQRNLQASLAGVDDAEAHRAGQRIDVLRRAFNRRGIDLGADGATEPPPLDLSGIQVEQLRVSDYAAYRFARRHAQLLGIPANTPFKVQPRRVARKKLNDPKSWGDGGDPPTLFQRQLFFKVSWTEVEANHVTLDVPPRRRVRHGVTLVVADEPDRPAPIALLRTDNRTIAPAAERDQMLSLLGRKGLLAPSVLPPRPGGVAPTGGVVAAGSGGVLRLKGVGHLLHVAGDDVVRVVVDFTLRGFQTRFGEALFVCGSAPELGRWRPERAAPLHFRSADRWRGAVTFTASVNQPVAFKFIIRRGWQTTWEGGENRQLVVPEIGILNITGRWQAG